MFQWRDKAHLEEDISSCEEEDEEVKELKASLGPITSTRNLLYCSNACLIRYLKARDWNVEKSKKMLEGSLKWRSVYKPEDLRWHHVAKEVETGKIYHASFRDRVGRTVLVLKPGRQNTVPPDEQIRFLIYMLENAILNLPEGQEQIVWLVDYTGWSGSKAPSIKTAHEMTNILQNHYPERLAYAILYNPPKIFGTFWKVVKDFMDPWTCHKIKFVYPKSKESRLVMEKNFNHETLPTEFGGKCSWQYDHAKVSHQMMKDDKKLEAIWGPPKKHENDTNGNLSPDVELMCEDVTSRNLSPDVAVASKC